jgi:capsular exopolysaccharide synthesis family protein
MTVALAAAVGFVLAAGGAYLIEYLDDTLKTPEEITRLLDVPVLGTIAEAKELKPNAEEPILVLEQPHSPITEAFRSLRTNLELAWKDGIPHTILVTSPGPGDGKTTIAVNLAATIAMAGKRVFLVDADFRRPGVHRFLRIPNRLGLSDAILKDLRPGDVAHVIDDSRLKVVPSGTQIERPTEQLSSVRMLRILARFRDESDITIFDSPAFLVADSLILASKLQAVLIVIQPGKTRIGDAEDMMEQLKRADANVLGVVLNRGRRNQSYYYGTDYREDGRRRRMNSRSLKTRRYHSRKQLEEKQKEWKPPFNMD